MMRKILRAIAILLIILLLIGVSAWFARVPLANALLPWISQNQPIYISHAAFSEISTEKIRGNFIVNSQSTNYPFKTVHINGLTFQYNLFDWYQWWQQLNRIGDNKNDTISKHNQALSDKSSINISETIKDLQRLKVYTPPTSHLTIDDINVKQKANIESPPLSLTLSIKEQINFQVDSDAYSIGGHIKDFKNLYLDLKQLKDDHTLFAIDAVLTATAIQANSKADIDAIKTFFWFYPIIALPDLQSESVQLELTGELTEDLHDDLKDNHYWQWQIKTHSPAFRYQDLYLTTPNIDILSTTKNIISLNNWAEHIQPIVLKADIKRTEYLNWQVLNNTLTMQLLVKQIDHNWTFHLQEDSQININTVRQTDESNHPILELNTVSVTPDIDFNANNKSFNINNLQANIEALTRTIPTTTKQDTQKFQGLAASLNGQMNIGDELSAHASVSINMKQSDLHTAQLKSTQAALQFKLNLTNNNQLALTLDKDGYIQTDSLDTDTLFARQNRLQLTDNITVKLNNEDFQLNTDKLTLSSEKISLQDIKVEPLNLSIEDININNNQTRFDYRLSPFNIILPFDNFKITQHNARFSMQADNIDTNGQIQLARLPKALSYRLSMNNDSGQINVKPVAPMPLTQMQSTLHAHLHDFIDELDVKSGTFNFNLNGRWREKQALSHTLDIDIRELSATFDEKTLQNMTLNSQLQIPFKRRAARANSHQIQIEEINVGVPITNIAVNFHTLESRLGELPKLDNLHADANIFGGSINIDNALYDLNAARNNINIDLKDIDLAQIIETQQLSGVEVSGKMQGRLPMVIGTDGVSMKDGELTSQGNGIIRYFLTDEQKQSLSNPLTDQVIAILEDFHYNEITAKSAYENDGNLIIDFAIRGTSPELYGERPVNLNLNTEQNVLSLLKSLQYTDNFNKAIEERFNSSKP